MEEMLATNCRILSHFGVVGSKLKFHFSTVTGRAKIPVYRLDTSTTNEIEKNVSICIFMALKGKNPKLNDIFI